MSEKVTWIKLTENIHIEIVQNIVINWYTIRNVSLLQNIKVSSYFCNVTDHSLLTIDYNKAL